MQHGFEITDDDGDAFSCTAEQIVSFVTAIRKAAEDRVRAKVKLPQPYAIKTDGCVAELLFSNEDIRKNFIRRLQSQP